MFQVTAVKSYLITSRVTLTAIYDMTGQTFRPGRDGFYKLRYHVNQGDTLSFLAPFWRRFHVGDRVDETVAMLRGGARKFFIPTPIA